MQCPRWLKFLLALSGHQMPKEKKSNDTFWILNANTHQVSIPQRDCFTGSFSGNSVFLLHVDYCTTSSINSEGGKNAFHKAWFYSKVERKKNTHWPTWVLK